MIVAVEAQKCTGCRICELICSFSRFNEFNPKRSMIRIFKNERMFLDIPVLCNQCPEAPCIISCSAEALKRREDGVVYVNRDSCNGCGTCAQVCPTGAIRIDPLTGKALICDLCQGEPQCVRWCPTGALSLGDFDTVAGVHAWQDILTEKWGIPCPLDEG